MIYYIYSDITSTQDAALAYVKRYGVCSECVAFRALVQSQGYGRRGAPWQSGLGNLALSVILPLRPWVRYRDQLALDIAKSMQTVLETYGVHTVLKAPNDLLWEGKKISGILAQILHETQDCWWAAVGVGMNINATPLLGDASGAVSYDAVSLFDILGYTVDVEEFTRHVLQYFQNFDGGCGQLR